jgi:hypothetical protein
MSLNKSSAISYNKGRDYSQQAITIIQAFAGATTTGSFDNQTVEAIYNMQKSPNFPFTSADGKVGPKTLGLIILELENAGRMSDAAILRAYPYTIQGVAGEINPVESFTQWTSDPLKLRTDGLTWYSMVGVFSLKLKLSPSIPDPKRYEYRQKIKGEAWSQMGSWNATKTSWEASGSWVNEGDKFLVPAEGSIPKGLNKDRWKEDGEIISGGKIERFGHRAQNATTSQGLVDCYVPNQNGYEYILKDTFGFKRNTNYVSGAKLWIELFYMGYVIDNQKPVDNQVILSKQWHYKCEDILP